MSGPVLCFLLGVAGWGTFLYGLHLLFSRQARRDIAAGAVFRKRMRKHVLRGGVWS